MADRTALAMIVHAAPPGRVRAFLRLAADHELDDGQRYDLARLELGKPFAAHEISCGAAHEIATLLVAEAPDATWTVSEDPHGPYLGDVYHYSPELGLWQAECSDGGGALFRTTEILEVADDRSLLAARLGVPWQQAIATLAERQGLLVTAPPLFDVEWGRIDGELTIRIGNHDGTDVTLAAAAQQLGDPIDPAAAASVLRAAGWLVDHAWEAVDRRARVLTSEVYRIE